MSKTKRYTMLLLSALVLIIIWAVKNNSVEAPLSVNEAPKPYVSDTSQLHLSPENPPVAPQILNVNQPITIEDTVEEIAEREKKQALIAEIDNDMQLTLPLRGDLSYMSPENETVQPIDPKFPAVEPENIITTLGEEASNNVKLGTPFEEKPDTQ